MVRRSPVGPAPTVGRAMESPEDPDVSVPAAWWGNVVAVVVIAIAVGVLLVALAVALVFLSGGFSGRGIWADDRDVCLQKCAHG